MKIKRWKSFSVILTLSLVGWGLSMSISHASPNDFKQAAEVHKESQLGFKEWKKNRVYEAKKALENYKLKNVGNNIAQKSKGTQVVVLSPAPKIKAGEAIRQLEFNVEIALSLTIHDYFALYLKGKTREQLMEVVKKLSPDELSELLVAYRQRLYDIPSPPPPKIYVHPSNL